MNHFFHPYTQQTTAMLCALACENAIQPLVDLENEKIGGLIVRAILGDPTVICIPPEDHPISGGEHDVVKDAIQEAIGGES